MLYILLSKTKAATYNVMYVYPFIVVFVEECAFMRPVQCNISTVVEFQRWWVLKSKIFGQESADSKDKKKNSGDE